MVAIGDVVGQPEALKQTHQTMDSVSIMKPVTKYSVTIQSPEAAGEAIANAFRAAMSPRQTPRMRRERTIKKFI
jgi:acetolactate synthase I/II/III large subunit